MLGLDLTDLHVDIHLLLVEDGLVLDTLIEEHPELIGVVDVVDEDKEEVDLLLGGEGLDELVWLETSELLGDSDDSLIVGSEGVEVFVPNEEEDETDDLRPEFLLVWEDPVDG